MSEDRIKENWKRFHSSEEERNNNVGSGKLFEFFKKIHKTINPFQGKKNSQHS